MKLLLFDTETTGLPKSRQSYKQGPNNWPHIVSISWVILNADTNQIETKKHYVIYPAGWDIPEESVRIHGITKEKAIENGFDLSVVMHEFLHEEYDMLVAHNLEFDYNVIGSAMLWDLQQTFDGISKPKVCTMEFSKFMCNLKYKSGTGVKPPKLSELYEYVFKESPKQDQLHNSLYDTMLLASIVIHSNQLRLKMNLPVQNQQNAKNEGKTIQERVLSIKFT